MRTVYKQSEILIVTLRMLKYVQQYAFQPKIHSQPNPLIAKTQDNGKRDDGRNKVHNSLRDQVDAGHRTPGNK